MKWFKKLIHKIKNIFTKDNSDTDEMKTTVTLKERVSGACVALGLMLGFFSINTETFSISSVMTGVVLFLVSGIIWWKSGLKLFSLKRIKLSSILFAIVIFFLIALIDRILLSMLGTEGTANDSAIDNVIQMRSAIWLAILGTFIGPIIEEVVYRGLGLNYIFKGLPWVGVIVLSTLFTMTHSPSSMIEFLIYFQSAVLFSVVYLKTKRLELPIMMHVINNSSTFIPLLFQ